MTPEDLNEAESSNGTAACAVSRAEPCSRLRNSPEDGELAAALALVDFGPCRAHPLPGEWFKVSAPMCAHCEGIENVDQAAGRILAEAYRNWRAAARQMERERDEARADADAYSARVMELRDAIAIALPELVNRPRPAYARRALEAVMSSENPSPTRPEGSGAAGC